MADTLRILVTKSRNFEKNVSKIPLISAIFGFIRIDKNADALGILVTKSGNFEKTSQTSP
jgi:hypothetical protein